MSEYLDRPLRTLAEVHDDLSGQIAIARWHDRRACALLSAFDTLAILDEEIELCRAILLLKRGGA